MKRTYTMSLALFSFFWKKISSENCFCYVQGSANFCSNVLPLSVVQCRPEAEHRVLSPASLSGGSLTKLLANTHSAVPCALSPDWFQAPGLLLCPGGDYRTCTTFWNNRAEDCNIRHDLFQLLEAETAVNPVRS